MCGSLSTTVGTFMTLATAGMVGTFTVTCRDVTGSVCSTPTLRLFAATGGPDSSLAISHSEWGGAVNPIVLGPSGTTFTASAAVATAAGSYHLQVKVLRGALSLPLSWWRRAWRRESRP